MTDFLSGRWLARKSEGGQSLVEYALILALVVLAIIAALTAFGAATANQTQNVADTVDSL